MKEFLTILFFSKTILLSSGDIDITREQSFEAEFDAITSGAALYIEWTALPDTASPTRFITELKQRVTPGSIYGKIYHDNGEVLLDHISYSYSNESVWMSLSSSGGVPVGVKFRRAYIYSRFNFEGVKIKWENSRK